MKTVKTRFQLLRWIIPLTVVFVWCNYRTQGQTVLYELILDEEVYDIDFNPSNQLLAVATDAGVRIYTENLSQVAYLQVHEREAAFIAIWNPTGTQLLTVGYFDPTPIIWNYDRDTQSITLAVTLPPTDPTYRYVYAASWNSDGSKLAVTWLYTPTGFMGSLGTTEVIETQNWTVESRLNKDVPFPSNLLSWRVNENDIAGAYNVCETSGSQICDKPTYFVGDIVTGTILWTGYETINIFDVKWSPDGSRLSISASDVLIFEGDTLTLVYTWSDSVISKTLVDWKYDSSELISVTIDGTVEILDISTLKPILNFNIDVFPEQISAVDWYSQSDQLFVISGEGRMQVWSTSIQP